MNQEIETKIEVSEINFGRVLKQCNVVKGITQVNEYYDFNGILYLEGGTFRIRNTLGSPSKMTLKLPVNPEEGTETGPRYSLEVEQELREDEEHRERICVEMDLPFPFHGRLHRLGIYELHRLGEMTNFRISAVLSCGVSIELDTLTLPSSGLVYEIEIESDRMEDHANALEEIGKLVTGYSLSPMSKFQRFYQDIQQQQSRKEQK